MKFSTNLTMKFWSDFSLFFIENPKEIFIQDLFYFLKIKMTDIKKIKYENLGKQLDKLQEAVEKSKTCKKSEFGFF